MTSVEVVTGRTPDGTRYREATDLVLETDATWLNFGTNGVTYLRSQIPASYLKGSLFIRNGDLTPRALIGNKTSPVVFYSMPREEFQQDEVAQLLAAGVKVIADVDDWLPAFIGKDDHRNKDKYTEEYVQGHLDAVGVCDLATCSTQFIADQLGEMFPDLPTLVIPNALSLDRWKGLQLANTLRNRAMRRAEAKEKQRNPKHRDVLIGWSGSVGHFNAFKPVVPILERVLRENPHVGFVTIGEDLGALLAKDVQPSVIRMGYKPFPQHPQIISQFHINLGVCEDNDFYRAKSDLRCLEAWASGSVFCGGHTTYAGTVRHREDGFVHSSPDELYAHLTLLVNDESLRCQVGLAGRARLERERLIEHTAPLWLEAIETARGM